MKHQTQIRLSIPTIDFSILKTLRGGYYINPSICSDSYDPNYDRMDSEYPEDPDASALDNEYASYDGQNDRQDDAENPVLDKFTFQGLSADDITQVTNSINVLPRVYHNIAVTITAGGINGSGTWLPGIVTLSRKSDGTIDTGGLHEELNHALQYMRYGDDMLYNSRSAYEYQAKMIEDLVQLAFGLAHDDFLSFCGTENGEVSEFWYNCFNKDGSLNDSYFIEHASDFYETFFNYYVEIKEEAYSTQYDPNFNWDWQYWLDLFGL